MKRESLLLALALIFINLSVIGALQPRATSNNTYVLRADAAYSAFLNDFWDSSLNYIVDGYPNDKSPTSYWMYAQGWDCILDNIALHQQINGGSISRAQAEVIAMFYEGQAKRSWYSGWYDDETWMTLALLKSYSLTQNDTYLTTAKTLFKDIMNGWDTTCCGSNPGGIWWDKAHTQKATASNAGPVIAALLLYNYLGDNTYNTFAQRVYTYWLNNMVNTHTYQVCDHINTNGTKVWWLFSYNEGLMLGASVQMHLHNTHNTTYLTTAQGIAGFIQESESVDTSYGSILSDGSSCSGDCAEFKGITYRYLTEYYRQQQAQHNNKDNTLYDFLKANTDALWNLARNTRENLFAINWGGPRPANGQLVKQAQQNAAVMALNLWASIA